MNDDPNDDQKHQDAQSADEELIDGASPLGSAPEDVEDIDETLKGVGLPNDDKGPEELNIEKATDKADKDK